ncbi:hypothetical protein EAJ12_20575 [Phocaeicola vulgatus]|nr:hypothetical protein EAJ12_20575 [Phocaeicola vulgatus]
MSLTLSFFNKFKKNSPKVQKSMIEKEFNDRIYTKSTAKREKYTIFMLQNIGLFRVSGFSWLVSFLLSV